MVGFGKFGVQAVASLVCGLIASSALAAKGNMTPEEAFYTLKKPTVTEVAPVQNLPDFSPNLRYVDPATAVMIAEKVIALGQKAWEIIDNNKPVAVWSSVAPFSVVPRTLASANPGDLDNWQGPAVKSFKVEYENLYGIKTASFVYTVHYQYGGQDNGKGAFICKNVFGKFIIAHRFLAQIRAD